MSTFTIEFQRQQFREKSSRENTFVSLPNKTQPKSYNILNNQHNPDSILNDRLIHSISINNHQNKNKSNKPKSLTSKRNYYKIIRNTFQS